MNTIIWIIIAVSILVILLLPIVITKKVKRDRKKQYNSNLRDMNIKLGLRELKSKHSNKIVTSNVI